MPAMADITIKKADALTDVVYKSRQPSAGDGSPARWSPDTTGARGTSPTYEAHAGRSGTSKRKVHTSLVYPVVRDVGGTPALIGVARGVTTFTFDLAFTDSEIAEAVAAHCNLTGAVVVRSMYQEGYSAT